MNWLHELRLTNPTPPALQLPLRYADATLDGIPGGTLRDVTTDYLHRFFDVAAQGTGCLFLGRAETFKTYAAAVIGRTANGAGIESFFAACAPVLASIDRDRYADTTRRLLRQLYNVPLLIVDDFTTIQSQSYQSQLLVEIAEARFSALKPTIWTGNLVTDPLKAMGDLYGPSFARRVHRASDGFRVLIK